MPRLWQRWGCPWNSKQNGYNSSMKWYKDTIEISTHGKGLYSFTDAVQERIRRWGVQEGMCFLSILHTSASLTINENYDPTAQADLEAFMQREVAGGTKLVRAHAGGARQFDLAHPGDADADQPVDPCGRRRAEPGDLAGDLPVRAPGARPAQAGAGALPGGGGSLNAKTPGRKEKQKLSFSFRPGVFVFKRLWRS